MSEEKGIERIEKKYGAQNIILETGKMAKQADGAVMVTYGETVVLVTACVSQEQREGIDFLPLSVDYREKTYAAGRIPGGFFKREGRPTEKEILTARLIDRPIRPLFPQGFFFDVQVMGLVLSSDGEYDPDILAVIGASSALTLSQAPFRGPVAAVRVVRINGEFSINPTYKQRQESDMELLIVGTREGVTMLEGSAGQVEEEVILAGIEFGLKELLSIIELQEEFAQKCGKQKLKFESVFVNKDLLEKIKHASLDKIKKVFSFQSKEQREEAMLSVRKELEEQFINTEEGITKQHIMCALEDVVQKEVRSNILNNNCRVDNRGFEDIRSISCEVSYLPRTHGSGLFTRGQTQSLAVTTLGTRSDEQMIEAFEGETFKSFMLHYNFPPFSVGEIKPVRGPGRREIGHGALAEKALSVVMPSKDVFPYTVRVVSEILESNGSSSMATVCASTLALMDAGVPIASPVAGVALGLVKEADKYVILTDLNGLEDHYGDMDFKVAGTQKGVTAIQLDLKIDCVDMGLLTKAFAQSKKARLRILDTMQKAIEAPRAELSSFAPRIVTLKIKQEKIGELIGPGGKTIRKIIDATGATIDIDDDGSVLIASTQAESSQRAIEMINAITQEIEVGKVYHAKVRRITNFGAFCEIAPGKDGLVHVSELADRYVKTVEDVVKMGDEFDVKVIGIDDLGRVKLSKKQLDKERKEESKQ